MQFWRLTLGQFAALVKRKSAEIERLDWRAALICSVMANTHRDPKTKREPFTTDDFMPRRKAPKPQTWQQHLTLIQLWNEALGGKDERPKPRKRR